MGSHGRASSNAFLDVSAHSKDNVTQVLILRFQEMLRDGVLKQGSRLPSERELATHFNVARSSLRQALKVLEIMGVITQRVGDGSYLNTEISAVLSVPMDFLFLLDDTSAQDLAELRLLVEPGLAGLAAKRATPEDIALLRQSVHDLEASAKDPLKMVTSDLLFHRAIFQASKNGPASSFFQTIHRAMAKMILLASQHVDLEHTLAFHRPIMDAIERGDAARASILMSEHLEDAAALLHREEQRQRDVPAAKRQTPSPKAKVPSKRTKARAKATRRRKAS